MLTTTTCIYNDLNSFGHVNYVTQTHIYQNTEKNIFLLRIVLRDELKTKQADRQMINLFPISPSKGTINISLLLISDVIR